MNYKLKNQQLKRELKRLKQDLKTANLFKDLNLQKWEKWEERARTLYSELHGKDAPPQGDLIWIKKIKREPFVNGYVISMENTPAKGR